MQLNITILNQIYLAGRLHEGWSINEAIGLKKRRKIL